MFPGCPSVLLSRFDGYYYVLDISHRPITIEHRNWYWFFESIRPGVLFEKWPSWIDTFGTKLKILYSENGVFSDYNNMCLYSGNMCKNTLKSYFIASIITSLMFKFLTFNLSLLLSLISCYNMIDCMYLHDKKILY